MSGSASFIKGVGSLYTAGHFQLRGHSAPYRTTHIPGVHRLTSRDDDLVRRRRVPSVELVSPATYSPVP